MYLPQKYKKHTVLMPVWKNEDLLSFTLPLLKNSISEETEIIVIINEHQADNTLELVKACGVKYIALDDNYGPLAVDFAMPLINGDYVSNVNSDMVFPRFWDLKMQKIIENNGKCSASCFLVEGIDTRNYAVMTDSSLGEMTQESSNTFLNNFYKGDYSFKRPKVCSYCHPITVTSQAFFGVGGYTDTFDWNWIPGYGLDDRFAFNLLTLYNEDFKFITDDEFCVFHGMSKTMNKLDAEIKSRSGRELFQRKCGVSIEQFRNNINIGRDLNVK